MSSKNYPRHDEYTSKQKTVLVSCRFAVSIVRAVEILMTILCWYSSLWFRRFTLSSRCNESPELVNLLHQCVHLPGFHLIAISSLPLTVRCSTDQSSIQCHQFSVEWHTSTANFIILIC